MKRLLTTILVCIMVLTLFSGCGLNKADEKSVYYVNETRSANSSDDGYGGVTVTKFNESISDNSPTSGNFESNRKLIKNATMAIEVKDVDDTYEDVLVLIDKLKGYEFSSSLSTAENYKRMTIVIKLPPEKIAEFKTELKELVGEGELKSSNTYSDDISEQYYDTEARLETLIISRDRLLELLKKAEETKDILEIEREIADRNAEINTLQGRIKMWDKLVAMATITLYIDQIDDPLKHTKKVGFEFNSFQEIWNTVKNGFVSVINVIYTIIIWIIIIVLAASPLLAIAALVIFLIKRRKKKKIK
jgi:hypothetical protein